MANHLIVSALLVLALALWLVGSLAVSRLVNLIPTAKRGEVLLLWLVTFAVLAVLRYYWTRYVSDAQASFWKVLVEMWPVYLMFLSGWFLSGTRSRRTPDR